jgi:hypothetical protein
MVRVLLALVMMAVVGASLVGCKAKVEETRSNVGAAQ